MFNHFSQCAFCSFRRSQLLRGMTAVVVFIGLMSGLSGCSKQWEWETLEAEGQPTARHEAGLVGFDQKLYLLGGRRVNPVDVFDPRLGKWTELSKPPVEIHHFQPVVYGDAIYILGAMTGQWPNETPLDRVLVYWPKTDTFEFSHVIPEHRRRGGAGAVVHDGKIYLAGGITNGHMNGYQPWLDVYDPRTGAWEVLPDAPHARDHFQLAAIKNKLYAFAGRRTSKATDEDMSLTVQHGNIYDLDTNTWLPVTESEALPTLRAGNSVFAWGDEIVVGGGESATQVEAHGELEAYNARTKTWRAWPRLQQGRHGSGFVVLGDYVYTASGAGNRGGGPELHTIERLRLPAIDELPTPAGDASNTQAVHKQWHTVTLNFNGPDTSETAQDNPYLNYRLTVVFEHGETQYTVRGYYAADGRAHETGADAGAVWQVKFTPPVQGAWSYSASLQKGNDIALTEAGGQAVPLSNAEGTFSVIGSDKEAPDFRALGYLTVKDSYFYFPHKQKYWLKGGPNSPENLLAYYAIDGTYRIQDQERDGESKVNSELHSYQPHEADWKMGDPTFAKEKGKSLFGAMNYLAQKGMNSAYFLTLNIAGDGNDVWPYVSHTDFTRFDVSKLAQWDQLFEYMQSKGILLHIVTQETENERLLDDGDVGPNRTLYYQELIARFGHHPALVWDLGEENGYAEWSPPAQNDEQRKAMVDFFSKHDPYNHPVLLHTHSEVHTRKPVLDALLGYEGLDGLSFQHADRTTAAKTIQMWKENSKAAGHEWLITMDEIGMWHTGANIDSLDPGHPSLRGDVLWGSLLSGAAGVEWYFGAKVPHNDLSSENWHLRDELWSLTAIALSFFDRYLPWWQMEPASNLLSRTEGAFAMRKRGEVYAVYIDDITQGVSLNLTDDSATYSVHWFDPSKGGELMQGSVALVEGGAVVQLAGPPVNHTSKITTDWVVLLRKQ